MSEKVTKDEITGVLYGIFTDFESSYEKHQGSRIDFLSSFAPEDPPSDHLGFWAAINGRDLDGIPLVLESLGKVSPVPGGSFVWDSFGIAKNYQFLPMVPRTIRTGTTSVTQMINIPWPLWLEIDPIPSSSETWQRLGQ